MNSATIAAPAATATISPSQAAELVRSGEASLVDVRDPDEHRREHVPGASLHPDSSFTTSGFPAAMPGRRTILLCGSGNRASKVAAALRSAGRGDVCVLEGGIDAWREAGLPVVEDAKAPLPIVRQVMMAAGAMLVIFTALAATVSPWFLAGTGFVGAGLFMAGSTGFCPMATMLAKMPWNRASSAPAPSNRSCSRGSCSD